MFTLPGKQRLEKLQSSIKRQSIAAALLAAGLIMAPGSVPAAEHTPKMIVGNFQAALLSVMKNADKLGVTGRFRTLEDPIRQAFDLDRMIRIATGRSWKAASEASKKALNKAFERLSIATYANQFSGYSGEHFKIIGERNGPQKTRLVETEIVRTNDNPAELTYVVMKNSKGWRIVDVLLDDTISQLAVRRSEYRKVVKSGGVDALIVILNKKTASLLKE